MAVPVVIDGYNLLYARGEAPSAESRERLLQDLGRWARARGRRAVIVFDAWAGGERAEREEARGPLTVCFTRYGERADERIVRWVTARPEAVVVTSDHAVQRAARRRGAAVLDAEAFAGRLDAACRVQGTSDPKVGGSRGGPPEGRDGPRAAGGYPPRAGKDDGAEVVRPRRLGRQAAWLRGL